MVRLYIVLPVTLYFKSHLYLDESIIDGSTVGGVDEGGSCDVRDEGVGVEIRSVIREGSMNDAGDEGSSGSVREGERGRGVEDEEGESVGEGREGEGSSNGAGEDDGGSHIGRSGGCRSCGTRRRGIQCMQL